MLGRTILVPVLCLGIAAAASAAAQQPPSPAASRCGAEMAEVQRMVAETPMPPAKETQIKALLEQVARACKENNDVVASAGLEQVKAIIKEQQKPAG